MTIRPWLRNIRLMKLEICYHRIDESPFEISEFVAKEAKVARAISHDVKKKTFAVTTKLETAILSHNDAEDKLAEANSIRTSAEWALLEVETGENIFLGQFGVIKAWIRIHIEELKVDHFERLVFRTDKALPRHYQGHHRDKDVPSRVNL